MSENITALRTNPYIDLGNGRILREYLNKNYPVADGYSVGAYLASKSIFRTWVPYE